MGKIKGSLPGTKKHVVIPDCQVKPGDPIDHLEWAGNYIAEKRPDVIHQIGDFNDVASLSTHAKGLELESKRYKDDCDYGREALNLFFKPIWKAQKASRKSKLEWRPQYQLYLGNHEQRIIRFCNENPRIASTLSLVDLGYEEFGWKVFPFLQVEVVDGVAFSHYFTSGVLGKPVTSARALVQKKHMSCVMGHVQKREVHYEYDALGKKLTGIFSGVFYQHDETYLGPQGNKVDRGIWVLYNVQDGAFNEQFVPLDYLKHSYS
jgi:hypothetical protein